MPGPPGSFPLGAAVTMLDLDTNLHAVLRRLRASEPVSWLPVLGGWLVTRRDLVLRVLRDSRAFTVDDPRFSTARVIGPSMLSLDGAEHKRHRDPFAEAFRTGAAAARLQEVAEAEAGRLVAGFAAAGGAEVRRSLAGPLAVAVVADVLGLGHTDPKAILGWYDEIVGAVSALAGQSGEDHEAGRAGGSAAFAELGASLRAAMAGADGVHGAHGAHGAHGERGQSLLAAVAGAGGLGDAEVVSNAAVLMFGGIETTEGMICNAVLHLLGDPAQLGEVIADPEMVGNAIEESLRLEPAAAVVDRYATADVTLAGVVIRSGDLVTVSLAGANRDPAVFADPDRFDTRRANARQNLAFAHGPHFCLGAHLARLETRAAVSALLRLRGLRLDPASHPVQRGVVFRKPPALHVQWDVPAPSAYR